MLVELRIDNFAIIDHLQIELGASLIVFTGETGAGKSIILDAIEAVLGGRVDPTFIRSGAERASVEATFHLAGDPDEARSAILEILEREDLLDDPQYLVMGREIRREGRSSARVNGRSVSVGLLRELGAHLVDVHGQSEHLSLLNVRQHLGLLDRYAGTGALLLTYQVSFKLLQGVRRELNELRQAEQDASRRVDLLTFQAQEIEAAKLQPGEEEELRQQRTRLANSENLATLIQEALALLDEGTPETPAITDLIGQVVHALGGLARIDVSRANFYDQADGALSTLVELARDLRDYQESIEFNPRRLEQIEERLDLIHALKRKYGGSIEAILTYGGDAKKQLDTIAHASERIAELEEQETGLLNQVAKEGLALSQKRQQAASALSRGIEAELADLRMAGARFSTDFQMRPDPSGVPLDGGRRVACDATGLDQVEFLIASNPGEGLKPLVKTASGGETSRLMLALKEVLAQADTIPTLIFDEIDQGIGGRVGLVVGQKLCQLGGRRQVLCVTHMPQLAAFGRQHYHVVKQVDQGRTVTRVLPLEGEARRQELAQMLGGVSAGTLHSADELIRMVDLAQKTAP